MPCHVALAVSAWSWLTAFAPRVSRSEKAVMSNSVAVVVDAEPELEDALDRDAARVEQRARRRGGPGPRRSARCRPRPACGS